MCQSQTYITCTVKLKNQSEVTIISKTHLTKLVVSVVGDHYSLWIAYQIEQHPSIKSDFKKKTPLLWFPDIPESTPFSSLSWKTVVQSLSTFHMLSEAISSLVFVWSLKTIRCSYGCLWNARGPKHTRPEQTGPEQTGSHLASLLSHSEWWSRSGNHKSPSGEQPKHAARSDVMLSAFTFEFSVVRIST